MTLRARSIPYAAYYAAVFFALGLYLPFWPLWLEERGLSAAEIGVVLAFATWTKVLAGPLAGFAADRSGNRQLVLASLAAASVVCFAAFALAHGFWTILAVQVAWALAFAALVPLGEREAMAAVARRTIDYGRVRLWGSITFVLAALIAGELLTERTASLVFWLVLAGLALTFAAAVRLPTSPSGERQPQSAQRFRALLGRRDFAIFLLAASLIQASHAVYYGFSALHWRAAGHSERVIGWLWAEGVIAEIVLFAVSGRLLRGVSPVQLLGLAGLAGVLRWSATALSVDLLSLIALQGLHGLTFGAAHLGAMHFIAATAPERLSATAQTLYSAVSGGVLMGLATWLGGALYRDAAGGAFLAMAVMSAAGFFLTLALARTMRSGASRPE